MVRSVENPSLRLASCVSVDVVNGGAGRSTPGFSSTAVTVHGRCAQSASISARPSASDSTRAFLPVSTPFSSKSLPVATRSVADARERRGEFAPVAGETRLEVPVGRRRELEPLFFAIDDEARGDALHAAGAQAGLHLLPQHRRDRVAVQAIEDPAAFLRADQVLVDVVRVLQRFVDRVLR